MTRVLVSVLFLLAATVFQLAQTGGDCTLSVRVLSGNDRAIDVPVHAEVFSPEGFVIATADGFGGELPHAQVASGKSYRIKVSGSGFETVTTSTFNISPMEEDHTETVHVKLDSQKAGEVSTPGPGTVSAIELATPKNALAENQKGMSEFGNGHLESAAAHFNKAATDYPRYARAYDMLGVISMRQLDRGKAREFFTKSISVDEAFFPAYVDLARLDVQDKRYAESESLLTKAISLNPTKPDAIALLATTEFANKEYEKALADVDRAHALPDHQQFAEIHVMAGKVLRMQNRSAEAIVQFQLFLQEKPNSPEAQSVRQEIGEIGGG